MRVLRGLIAAVVVVCLGLIPVAAATRSLSFEERVTAQRAIEQVYWSHRIWPKENTGPKLAHASGPADLAKLGARYSETVWHLGNDQRAADPQANAVVLDADEWREK